jgi:hypothetical protein
MFSSEQLNAAKAAPITQYLAEKGLMPDFKSGKQYAYRSPLTNERSASLFVEPDRNVFNDFSSGESGDAIRLVQKIEGCSFIAAVNRLLAYANVPPPSLSFSGITSYQQSSRGDNERYITGIRTLTHPALIQYCTRRSISAALAAQYCQQVHYMHRGRNYFGIGFKTDSDTYAVRSESCKTWLGKGDISTLYYGSGAVNIFEGFFSFLSALQFYQCWQPKNTTIILNSVSHIGRILETLKQYATIYTYLDNDDAGRNATHRLIGEGFNVQDQSVRYAGHNDFNDYLCTVKHNIVMPI